MEVGETNGHKRGEDQDFIRKSALFALGISEVLNLNSWRIPGWIVLIYIAEA